MKISQLPIWAHDVQHGVALGLQISRQARAVGAGAFDAKGFDTAQSGRPCLKASISVTGGRDSHGTLAGALCVDNNGNMIGFVRINADDELVHVSPLGLNEPGHQSLRTGL